MVLCQLCSNQELFESIFVIEVAAMNNTDGASYCLKVKYPYCFFVSYVQLVTSSINSATFNSLHSQELLVKSTSVIKVATMKNKNDFR